MHSSSPVRTPGLQLAAEYQSTGECWFPPKKDTPRLRVKEKPQQDGRRGKTAFRIKFHTHQRHWEGSNKPCAHQDPETPQRLRQNGVWVSPLEVHIISGLLQGQGLWMQQTWVWHKSSWRRSPLTHHRAARTYTGLGKHSWRAQTCANQDTGERSSDLTRDRPRLARECPGVSSGGDVCWQWPAAGLGALSAAMHAWELLKELAIIFITSTIIWPQDKQQGEKIAPCINRKLN